MHQNIIKLWKMGVGEPKILILLTEINELLGCLESQT